MMRAMCIFQRLAGVELVIFARGTLTFIGMLGLAMLVGCRTPTQVTIEISTDVPCVDFRGVTITVGTTREIEDHLPGHLRHDLRLLGPRRILGDRAQRRDE